jgi:hypothetical protein
MTLVMNACVWTIGEMAKAWGKKKEVLGEKPLPAPLVPLKVHTKWPGTEPGFPWSGAGDQLPKPPVCWFIRIEKMKMTN